MNPVPFASLLLAAAAIATPARAQSAVPVKDFDIYVDLPSSFVFVKLPTAWRFVGKLAPHDLPELPRQVLTTLLEPEPAGTELRSATSLASSADDRKVSQTSGSR
jgi:hypothetical protein